MINLKELTIKSTHEHLKNGDFTVLQLAEGYLKSIKEQNGNINAYINVWENIKEQAEAAQKKFEDGTATLLTGIPFGIKDVFVTKDQISTGGSKILEHYKPPYTSTAVEKLEKEGAIILGKTNTDEFAQGASTENSAYGVTKNPHDETRVAGGTSGGSAAAIAADMALGSLGTDTGGSIRQPSGFCGVVGLKPTYGKVSRHGVMAMASSFDCPGPITKTVEDAEIVFNAIKGVDKYDATSVEGDIDSKVKTIGVPRSYLKKGVDPDVLENFEESLSRLKDLGYEIKEIEIPYIEYSVPVYYVLVPAEVSSNMARYDGIKYGESAKDSKDLLDHYLKTRGEFIGPEVKRRIILGTYVLSAGYADQFYNKAWQVRNLITEGFKKVFEDVDLIALPTSPTPAFKIGEKSDDPLAMYLSDIFTSIANIAGVPAISIPSGFAEKEGKKLPLALELFAPHKGENRLFETGKKFESK